MASGVVAGRRECARVRDVERAIWRVRWFGIPFAIVQTLIFEPTAEGVTPPFDLLVAGFVMAGVLLVAQVVGWRAMRSPVARAVRLGYVALALDTAVASAVPVIYAFDHMSTFWPIITFPILEGAMRAGIPGSMAVWAFGSTTFVVNSLRILESRPNPSSWIGSMPWATSILLMVAMSAGALGSRVAASDRAVDGWRQRLLRLTDRTDKLARLDSAPAIWAEAEELARAITDAERVVADPSAAPVDLPPWARDGDGHARTCIIDVPGDEGRLGRIHLDTPCDDMTADDHALLDLLARHVGSALLLVQAAATQRRRSEGLEVLAQQKNEFLAMLAHELRTPMTVIAGNAKVLESHRGMDPEIEARIIEMMGRNIGRLQQLVDDASDVMRIDASELPVAPQAVAIAPIVRAVVVAELVGHEDHVPIVDIPRDMPPAMGDPDRIAQILHNLVSNAVKYSPDGGVVAVGARVAGDRLVVGVTDEGVGIPEERLGRLFGRLERLHPELEIRGTGLGLYLSRELARAMGGDIAVSTVPGQGATFTLTLPVASPDEVTRAASPLTSLSPA